METYKIYLSGGMSFLTWEEQTKWRRQVRDAIKYGDYDHNKNIVFFDPTQYYNFEEKQHKTEKEIMEFDLYNLRNSDLVIVNFNNHGSIGTAMELMLAKELRIPIIAFGAKDKDVHPWLLECCTRVCDSMRDAVNHVAEFYLN